MGAVSELNCQAFVELVTDYFEEALPRAERRRFERHVAACDGCDTYLEQMRQTLGVLGRIDAEAVPDDVRDHLLHAFRGWRADTAG